MKSNRLGMLICTAVATAWITLPASAADETPSAPSESSTDTSPSTDITRLSYYPHARKLYVAPDLAWIPTDTNSPQRNGGPLSSSATKILEADATVSYGLPMPGWRISASESWQIHRWTNTTGYITGFVRQVDSSGFSDPTFQANYRYIDSGPWGFAGDVSLSISPSWVTHTVATTAADGNDGRGFGTASLGASFYWIQSANDVGITASLTRDFSGTGVDPTDPSASYSRDSTWVEIISLSDRYHFTSDFYGQIGASFDLPYSYDQTNEASPPATTNYQIPFHMNPNLLVGYRVGEKFTLDASFTYLNYTTTSAPVAPPNTETKAIENTFQFRARFEI